MSMVGPTEQAVFSADGSQVATADYDHKVRLWDLASGSVRELQGLTDSVTSVCWRAAPPRVVAGDRSGMVLAWPTEDAKPFELTRFKVPITGIACSPDGSEITVAAGNYHNLGNADLPVVRTFSPAGKLMRGMEGRQSADRASGLYRRRPAGAAGKLPRAGRGRNFS